MAKKILAVVLTLVMAVAVLTGCGGPKESPDEILKKMKGALNGDITSYEGSMEMGFNIKALASDMNIDVVEKSEMEYEVAVNKGAHMKMNNHVEALEETKDIALEMYIEFDGDSAVSYIKDDDDEWYSIYSDKEDSFRSAVDMATFIGDTNSKYAYKSTEKLDGREVYVIEATVPGSVLNEALANSDSTGLSEELDYDDVTFPVELYIGTSDYLIYKISMDISSVMQTLIEKSFEEARGAEELDMNFKIENCTIEFLIRDYNTADDFSVPKEVKEEAGDIGSINDGDETDTDEEEGYILKSQYDGKDYLMIECPDGFIETFVSDYYVDFANYNTEYEWSLEDMAYNTPDDLKFYIEAYSEDMKNENQAATDAGEELPYGEIIDIPVTTVNIGAKEVNYNGVECTIYGSRARILRAWEKGEDAYAVCLIYQMLFSEEDQFSDIVDELMNAYSNVVIAQ